MKFIKGHILPRRDLYDSDGTLLPMSRDAHYRATLDSMRAWVHATRPSVLREHDRDGLAYGSVVDVLDDEDGIWVVIEMGESLAEAYEAGQLRYVSAYCAWGFLGDDGTEWYAALPEVSVVSVPRFAIGQRPIAEYTSPTEDPSYSTVYAQLSEAKPDALVMVSGAQEYTPPTLQEETMDREEMKEMIAEMVAEAVATAMAAHAEARAAAEAAKEAEAELAESEPESESEPNEDAVAMLMAQVEELTARLAEYEAAEVESELQEAGIEEPEVKEAMLSLRRSDEKAYQTILKAKARVRPTAPSATPQRPRVALSLASTPTPKADVTGLSTLMAQGMSYFEAKAKLGIA